MADVEGLYIVTGVVLVALFGWVLAVLARAPNAVDVSRLGAAPSPSVGIAKPPLVVEAGTSLGSSPASSPDGSEAPVELSATPPPTVTSGEPRAADSTPIDAAPAAPRAKGKPVHTMLGLAAPSPIAARSRLDSHLEIQDAPASATILLMPEGGTGAKESLIVVTAVGFKDPLPGKSPERHAILDRYHLLVFADGGGKKAGEELASAIVVDALTVAFEKDDKTTFADDPKLPERANRIRRAVLAANRRLLHRARESGYAGMGTSLLAAYFSPDHRELVVAHIGASRAYCVRNEHLTRLTTPHGARMLGVIERVDVEVVQEEVRAGDLYVFCSDALGRALSESELLASMNAEPSLDRLTRKLVEMASATDDAQNLVAIVARVDAATEGPRE